MNIPKCKAWDQTNHEWVNYGFCLRFDADGNSEVLNAFAEPFKDRKVIPVLGIGLTDKHGKDIYEGDIIRYDNDIYTIRWNRHLAQFALYWFDPDAPKGSNKEWRYEDSLSSNEAYEVIGNVYENPNLIEDQSQPTN